VAIGSAVVDEIAGASTDPVVSVDMSAWRTAVLLSLILLFVYPFLIYPVVLHLWARRKKNSADDLAPAYQPRVAMIICALNEQGVIGEKLKNSMALEYPAGKLTIVVVSDGSTDRTAAIVRSYESSGVVLVEQKNRRGKIANLNEIIPARTEEVVVLSDANVLYDGGAVKELVARFADPEVGCVTGKVILTDTTPDLHASTEQYYSMEWGLQRDSSLVHSMVGADGAMYALRRELFRPCPNDTLIEDLVIPMQVIAQSKRVVFESKALGWERGVESLGEEWRRKVRIAAGAGQGLVRGNVWPKNAPGRFWFIFVSHKLLRWISPVLGLLVLGAAIFSWNAGPFPKVVLLAAALVMMLAVVRLVTGWRGMVFSAPFYFVFGQAAIAVGMVKGMLGTQSVLWAKVDR